MTQPLLQVKGLSKRFGGFVALDGIDLDVAPGERLGLIGPNGSGKSTLVNCICGTLQNETGSVTFEGRTLDGLTASRRTHLGVARSFQQTNTFATVSVEENLYRARRFAHSSGDNLGIEGLLDEFSLSSHLAERADKLPYGLQKMLGLVMALASRPKFLLLDEPAAGLERRERTQVDRFVDHARQTLGCGVLVVEHDMDLVKRVCPHIVVLESGRLIADGPPAEVLARRDVIDAYLGTSGE